MNDDEANTMRVEFLSGAGWFAVYQTELEDGTWALHASPLVAWVATWLQDPAAPGERALNWPKIEPYDQSCVDGGVERCDESDLVIVLPEAMLPPDLQVTKTFAIDYLERLAASKRRLREGEPSPEPGTD